MYFLVLSCCNFKNLNLQFKIIIYVKAKSRIPEFSKNRHFSQILNDGTNF